MKFTVNKALAISIIMAGAVLAGLLSCLPAHADVPAGVFFFQDGKGYDASGQQKYFCFQDGSCYLINGTFAFDRSTTVPVATTTEVSDPLLSLPAEGLPHLVSGGVLTNPNEQLFTCQNVLGSEESNDVDCTNNTGYDVVVKGVLLDNIPVPNGDYSTIQNLVGFYTNTTVPIAFTASSTNTSFWDNSGGQLLAKISLELNLPVTLPAAVGATSPIPLTLLKTLGNGQQIFASTVLANVNGHDAVYQVTW